MSVATDKDQEFVLCVAASAVRELFGRGNWVEADHAMLDNSNLMFDLGKTEFVRRIDCETDPSRKQVIPYLLLRHDGKFYCYTRGKAGGEDRLHAKLSIGIGGHINYDDDCEDLASTIELAGSRELDEEVKLSRRNRAMPVDFAGLISDDSDDVGQVHLGVVLIVDLASPAVSLRDRALTNGHWATTEELSRDRDKLETWSRICMDHAIGGAS